MSYILEALKKAEAERRSGSAPSIHTPHSYAPAAGGGAWWRRPPLLIGAAALLLAGATGAWFLTRPPAPSAPSPAPAPSAPPVAAAAPPPVAAVAPPPAPVPKKAERPPAPAEKEKPVKKAVEKKPAPAPAPRKAETPQPAKLATLKELPEQVRREIPQLQVGGYIYSGNKADRSVVINRRLLREGDEVAPGLVLEQLMPNGMVLNYQGNRYRSSY